ncbi:MAG TPA: carbon-nitrogen hydrolase family protein, partial [Ktedonobacterales bacterium]|nr:carbon-nitrogen hydrolase family protein [Ktedonobacterales bacterium]
MTRLHTGLVQMRCEKGAIGENLAAIERYIAAGVKHGADILCFPEASITGYVDPLRYPAAVLGRDDLAIARFVQMTLGKGITVLAGFVEANPDGKPFITQIVAHEGQMLGWYRKRTIPDDETHLYAPDHMPGVFTCPKGAFGVAICADIENAALFAEHAQHGARIIFEAAAPGLYGEQATRDWQAGYLWWQGECMQHLSRYARELGVWIAAATQAGRTRDEDFPGGGYVFAPDGTCIHQTHDWNETVLYADIDI